MASLIVLTDIFLHSTKYKMHHVIHVMKEVLRHPWEQKLTAPMGAFATVKQPKIFIGESHENTDSNIELHYLLKINEEFGRFNRAITTVADAALDSDGCLGLS